MIVKHFGCKLVHIKVLCYINASSILIELSTVIFFCQVLFINHSNYKNVAKSSIRQYALHFEDIVELHPQSWCVDLVCLGPCSEKGNSSVFVTSGLWLSL